MTRLQDHGTEKRSKQFTANPRPAAGAPGICLHLTTLRPTEAKWFKHFWNKKKLFSFDVYFVFPIWILVPSFCSKDVKKVLRYNKKTLLVSPYFSVSGVYQLKVSKKCLEIGYQGYESVLGKSLTEVRPCTKNERYGTCLNTFEINHNKV